MPTPYSIAPGNSSRLDDGVQHLPPSQAAALLHKCYGLFEAKLLESAKASLELAVDLFESNSHVPDGEVQAFLSKRGEWLERFPQTLRDLFERRISGQRRKGRRPDADVSLATLRVLTAYDHEKQAALTAATSFLAGFTRRERSALDLRIDELLADATPGDIDNPFDIEYIVDALGATSRAVYPNPRVWRPLLERLLADMRSVINKTYLTLNRLLADEGVLPEIKAALRVRSDLRPSDDRDLLETFAQMLGKPEAGGLVDVPVPEAGAPDGAAPAPAPILADAPSALPVVGASETPPEMDSEAILSGLAALAEASATMERMAPAPTLGAARAEADARDLPGLDPLMAMGTSTQLFKTLGQLQKFDLNRALADVARANTPDGTAGVVVPLNLIPHIRAAIDAHITNPADAITMDVIALLFDYIFRDASISDETRPLFGRLQVPIVKSALLDRTFFSDKRHPARLLLDHLADAAIGTAHHDEYRAAFVAMAQRVIDDIVSDFDIDISVFRSADERVRDFVETERRQIMTAVADDVVMARAAEEGEAHRAAVISIVRDRLAGIDLPFEVRSFVETAWTDYLAGLYREPGLGSDAWEAGLATLDDMLWSIVIKERKGQKARLARTVPKLVASLRKGCNALGLAADRTTSFFEALYQLHMAAIKPNVASGQPQSGGPAVSTPQTQAMNVHDYVVEMIVGTWLTFTDGEEVADARLTYVSPQRTKYVFTGRYHSTSRVFTPEELAYLLGSGKARVLAEPVPLWDRAVSAALETLAARHPRQAKRPAPTTLPA
ncbi:MAG TPA: DUF1631 family protein [Casimicrobiaceae bacterium]|nr:DUF1631 family protein [Casimicrobiaceae bacterium]